MHRANEVREIMGPWTELPVTPKHQLLVRQKFGNRGGIEMEERGAVAAEAQELNDQRQMMAAEALKALLEAELRKHGSGSEVVIAPVGELGDWTAAHGDALDPEAADAYLVLLSRLK